MSRRLRDGLLWMVPIASALGVLLTARLLQPAAAGHGTHQQLGLPPCGFLYLTGLPCPGCGLTTAFAHMARGEWLAASAANPLGVPLFLLCAGSLPWSLWHCRKRSLAAALLRLPLLAMTACLAGALFLAWGLKVLAIVQQRS